MLRNKERWAHAIGEFGNNLVYNFFNGFLLLFYTDVMELSASFTSLLFLVSRIIVAASDPIVGLLSDRTESRFGKYRAWLIVFAPIVALFLVLSFISPSENMTVKYVWSFLTFIVLGVSFTATDVPFWTLPSVMTDVPEERASVFSLSGQISTISGGLAGFAVPLIVARSSSLGAGYFGIAIVFGLILFVCYYYCAFTVKERVQTKKENLSLKSSSLSILKNKPLLIVSIAGLFVNIGFFLRSSTYSYYGIYVLGHYSCVSIMTLMILFGRLIGSYIAPMISKKKGNKEAMLINLSYGILSSTLLMLVGIKNTIVIYAMTLLSAISNGAFFVILLSMISDTIDYGEYKFNTRNDGMITSLRTFITKIGSALAGSAIAFYLALIGYQANVEQSLSVKRMLHLMFSIIPALFYLIGLLIFLLYPLGQKNLERMEKELVLKRQNESK